MLVFFLNACNGSKITENAKTTEIPPILEVELQIDNEHPAVGASVTISAKVTQGDIAVDDASDVSFEVWEKDSDHEMIKGEYMGNGLYSIKKVFDEAGFYTIVAHVTARDQHTMPKKELTVGNPNELEVNSTHQPNHVEHVHQEGDLTIEFTVPDELIANKSIILEAYATHEGKPVGDSMVKYEIWEENDTRHDFIEAEEVESGLYQTTFEFNKAGKYFVTVHIQNDELHEHIQRKLIVGN
jgi:hypothetical protein